jgi:transmembrane sensor
MTNVKDPLGQDALVAEASRWFAALDAGTARQDEFEAWRNRDPAHAVAYARIVGNWESIARPAAAIGREIPARASRRHWLKAAAIGLPVAVLGSGLLASRAYAWENATTRVGETRRVALPDGSVAHLNTDTSLSWRFGRQGGALRLDRGEVALDMRRGQATILHVNETSFPLAPGLFDARIASGQAELTFIDGAPMRLPGNGAGTLRPNDTVIVGGGRPRIETLSSERVASLIAWRAGEIIFLDQSVGEAAENFNRYLTRKIVVGNAELAREKIGGRFDLNRPDQFLKAVSLSLNARVISTAAGYELTR